MDGGNWGDPNNTNGTPQSGDDATFSIAATINDSGQADNLYVDADLTLVGMITASFAYVDYTFDIQGMMTTTMSFEVDDYTTTVESGGDLETDNSGTGTAAIVDGGEIDVDGGTFDLTGGAVVGASRYGDLVIENGGTADFTQTSNDYAALGLGDQTGSYGDAEVTGGSTLTTNVGGITIGVNGSGDLDIDGGSEVTVGEDNPSEFSGAGAGKNADSDGSLEVYDGSTFTVTDGGFDDGYDGSGSVDVEGGSTVSIENDTYGNLSIGSQSDGSGDFYISDSGSTLSVAATLIVGDAGEGTLEIENGATVEADSVTVAGQENDDPSSISIDGDGSDLSVDKILTVGDGGTGYLYMTGGATVEAQNLNIAVQETSGDPDSGMQSEVSVEGDNTQLTIDDAIVVGLAGTGSLSISDGGVVEADSLDVANQATSGSTADDTPSTVSVDGNDSTLTIKGEGFIGDGGYGSLTLSDGATASFDSLDVATQDTSGSTSDQMPSSVTVTGNSTELKIEDGLFVGDSGYGVVGITEGASVTADGLDIAFQASSGSAGDSAYSAVNVDGSGSKLTIDGDGFVGDAGLGALTLVDGATASFQTLDIATQESSGSTDEELASYVYLDGDDTSLDVEESIFVGDAGYGRLEIADGATVTGDTIVVAHDDTSGVYGSDHDTSQSGVTGQASDVYIHGEGSSLTLSGTAFVGDAGFGYIDVWDGSEMSAASLDIAVQASSGQTSSHNESFIEVNNANSNLQVSGDAKVGDAGYGALTDFDGATTSIGGDLDIAAQASSGSAEDEAPSFVTVQGSGSKMIVTGTTTIGDAGDGLLGIYDGGVFTTGGDTLEIAAQAESTGELQVENADTTFTFSGDVTDGDEGDGTIDIEDGATVTIGGKLFVGTGEDSVSKLDIEGEGSSLTVKGDLILGQDGEADVTIGDGGDLTVDGNVNAGNSTVDIEGDPTINGDLNLGIGTPGGLTGGAGLQTTGVAMWTLGGGTTLTVTGTVDMGVAAGDMGTLTVTGANTQFIVRTDLIIGDAGTGTLNVQNGAAATITGAITIGAQATGIGTLTINGNGSTVTAGAQDVTIGDAGTGTLNVQMGGLLDADSVGITLGSQNGAAGTLTVANMDSEVDAGTLTVGDDGMGDATISTGGALSVDGDATLGAQSNGNGQVAVSDAQSSFDVGGGLTLGDAGSGQLLDDGDTSVSGALTLGAQAGSSGQVTVNVGTLDVDGDAAIGKQGSGTLLVQLAGTFTAHDVTLADALGSSGTFTVDGDGTTATTDDLTIGTSGSGMLNVTGGAMLTTSGDATLGDAVSANIDMAKVDTQANWGIDGDLTVGSSGIATLNVTGGGSVTDSGNVVFGDQSAASGEATVSGSITNQDSGDTSASTLNWGQTLTVGNYGYGTLTLAKGALVAPTQGGSGEVDVAAQAGSTGSISLTDAGTLFAATDLVLGGTLDAAGGSGTLTASSGAAATISDAITMWNGTLDVSQGGSVTVGSATPDASQGTVDVEANGSIDGSGTITGDVADDGTITAAGGTLVINGDVTGNGFIEIGDGATVEIDGSVGSGVTIDYESGAGSLVLGSPSDFDGTIGDAQYGDTITLNGVDASEVSVVGDPLLDVDETDGADLDLSVAANSTDGTWLIASETGSANTIKSVLEYTDGNTNLKANIVDTFDPTGLLQTYNVSASNLDQAIVSGAAEWEINGSVNVMVVVSTQIKGYMQALSPVYAPASSMFGMTLPGSVVETATEYKLTHGGASAWTAQGMITGDAPALDSGSVSQYNTLLQQYQPDVVLVVNPAFISGQGTRSDGTTSPILDLTTGASSNGAPVTSGEYDGLGVAAHEFGHALGISSDTPNNVYKTNFSSHVTGIVQQQFVDGSVTAPLADPDHLQQNAQGSPELMAPGTTEPTGTLLVPDQLDYDILKAIDPGYFSSQPCYCPGTLIMTDKGDMPVEALTIGDQVLTHAGELRPIKWIGRRSYGSRFVMGRKDILPVRIKAGALGRDASGESLPRRDLWISPHHAMYLDGVLIEAKDLLNGVSIVQTEQMEADQACEVTYIHIELDSHDVILAEGAWSETFLDENNRGMFHNAGDYQALYPQPQTDLPTHARYYAPRLDGGFAAERIRQNIAALAGIAAQPETTGPLRGFIDLIDTHSVQGWAQDCDHPDVPVCLAIHEGETLLGHVLAGGYRADLAQAGVGSGHHAFVFSLPARKASASSNIIITRALDGARLAMSETAHAALTSKSRLKLKAHVTPGARRAILRDAHRKRRTLHITMSDALKLAWAAFKSQTQTPSAAAATLTERAA
jgi:T5SS/PEP-CTERM-associated repeat protein